MINFLRVIILIPLSWLYGAVVAVRSWCYTCGLLKIQKLSVPVVCVGNITAGGTGKTPCLISLVRFIRSRGKKAVILTRGHRRKSNGPVIIAPGEQTVEDHTVTGDEPLMIARELPAVPIVIDADRYRGGSRAVRSFHPDIVVMDDGFQHHALARDMNVVMVDCTDPWGQDRYLPAGRLRESLKGLRRAAVIILTRCDQADARVIESIEHRIASITAAPVLHSVHKPVRLDRVGSNEHKDLSFLKDGKVIVMCGIGNSGAFKKSVERLGAVIKKDYVYADHHCFTGDDLNKVGHAARQYGACVVTTAKDAVRIPWELVKDVPVYALIVSLEITENDHIVHEMIGRLVS